jgi:cyclophilin family peptidyl-prolyl cis-trans isomerase
MRLFFSTTALVLALALTSLSPASAQDKAENPAKPKAAQPAADQETRQPAASPAPAAAPPATAADFPRLHQRWQALDKQLDALGQQFAKAPTLDERTVIRSRYVALVEESEKLLPQLRQAADAAFDAAPGKDPDVTRIMVGLAAYDYRRDDYEAVLVRARRMMDAQVEEPALYALAGASAFHADDYESAEKWLTKANESNKLDAEASEYLKHLPQRREAWNKEQAIRQKEAEADDLPRVKLQTSKGTIVVELFENEAPQTVANFISLVESKFYDNTVFHRVLPGFMAQGGDPKGDGTGGPTYNIYCECYREDHRKHFRGSLSMAHAGRDTGGSQFFLTFHATPHLDGMHTVFGRVIEGMDVLARLQRRDPTKPSPPAPDRIVKAEVLRKRDHEYKPTKVEKKEPADGEKSGQAKGGNAEKAQPKAGGAKK